MGECGCGLLSLRAAYPIAGTEIVLGIEEYAGCANCETPAGYAVNLYTPEGWERWRGSLSGELGAPMVAGDDGGNAGCGWVFPLNGPYNPTALQREIAALREQNHALNERIVDLLRGETDDLREFHDEAVDGYSETSDLSVSTLTPGQRLWSRSNDGPEPDCIVVRPDGLRWILRNQQGVELSFNRRQLFIFWRTGPDREWVRQANARVERDEAAAEAREQG